MNGLQMEAALIVDVFGERAGVVSPKLRFACLGLLGSPRGGRAVFECRFLLRLFTNVHTLPWGDSGRQARREQSNSPTVSILNTTERPRPAAIASDLPAARRGNVGNNSDSKAA